MTDLPDDPADAVANCVTSGLAEDAAGVEVPDPAPDPSPRESAPPKRKRGAPLGNVNRAGSSLDAKTAMLLARLSKAPARAKRNRDRRRGEEEAREIAAELKLDKLALGRRVCRRLVDVEQEIRHLGKVVEDRGRFSTKGEMKPWYAQFLRLQSEDRAELRRLVDDLRALPEAGAGSLVGGELTINLLPAPSARLDGSGVMRCPSCDALVGVPPPAAGAPLPATAPPSAAAAENLPEETDPVRRRVAPPAAVVAFPVPCEVPRKVGKFDFNGNEIGPPGARDPAGFQW